MSTHVAGGATVGGIPLRPGERVVHYNQPDFSTAKTLLLIAGIVFLVVLIGIIFLIKRSKIDQNNPRLFVITNQRVIVVQGSGETVEIPVGEIADITAIRHASRVLADRQPKNTPSYWRGGTAIGATIRDRRGQETVIRCEDRPDAIWQFGQMVAHGLMTQSFDQFPSVNAPA